jgi:hypothetical protein
MKWSSFLKREKSKNARHSREGGNPILVVPKRVTFAFLAILGHKKMGFPPSRE